MIESLFITNTLWAMVDIPKTVVPQGINLMPWEDLRLRINKEELASIERHPDVRSEDIFHLLANNSLQTEFKLSGMTIQVIRRCFGLSEVRKQLP